MTPNWTKLFKSHIWIFNVGRGISIFIRTPLNQGIIYDFGCSQSFKPSEFLKENIIPYLEKYKGCNIAQTIISHPHADHIADIECLLDNGNIKSFFYSSLHTCPHDKSENPGKPEAINWNRIKNPEWSENSIKIYKNLYSNRNLPLQTICYDSSRTVPNLEYGLYYVRPPIVDKIHRQNDQDYGNGISLVFFYRHGNHTLLIPGDITPESFKYLLYEYDGFEKRYTIFSKSSSINHPNWHLISEGQPSLRSLLNNYGLSILIAPHHGLESGFSQDLYNSIKNGKPELVVLSEKRSISLTDGSIHNTYQSKNGATGLYVDIEGNKELKYTVSTKNRHHILILFEGTGIPKVYLDRNPMNLLKKL